ncbi:MAG: glycosyltransferase [Verrucomicrobiota bacterium]|nr:glycosyltransferase [Verrucomicrobiota bacterium]
MLIYSLTAACSDTGTEVCILSERRGLDLRQKDLPATSIPLVEPTYFRGEKKLRQWLRKPIFKSELMFSADKHGVSVLLPLLNVPADQGAAGTIGWIPDFQHRYLAERFSDAERRKRDANFKTLVNRATLVLLSSEAALANYQEFARDNAPKQADKARVVPFPSLFAFELLSGDPEATRAKFKLPPKFILVANQFWEHKNHRAVVEAIRQLREKGIRIPVVLTGMPIDALDSQNMPISRLLQAIAAGELREQITVLGLVDKGDLINLMRIAALVVQPSLFEGWSTVVQDAKALGRPLICSDIAVHREQAPGALGHFPPNRPDLLADLLAAHWERLEPGPDRKREEIALSAEREFAQRHGKMLLRVCQEAARF